jgi:large subunit ribosomal protein L17
MRHLRAGRNLGRAPSHRSAMVRNMVTSLFKHEQMETTDARAKELRQVAERMVTLAKRGDLHARRQALATIREKTVVHKLFDELKDRFMDRQGGYVRIVKKENRKGDGALISIVQLLLKEEGKKKGKKRGKTAAGAADPSAAKKKKKEAKPKEKSRSKKKPDQAKPEGAEKKAP